ncbi:MAG: O-acetylhomoserine aminocarboxypropyltransferase/cysteine synthase, partial [Oscillospiraceae bacterium]|nr:O-acetylhomoserine aminocarboxypropyltransferase/cysteine synthase [Oscillospiraceae bacterium]
RENGSLEYEGSFLNGMKDGEGTLYGGSSNKIYTGNFSQGNLLYSDLVGKTTAEAGSMYTGEKTVYTDEEYFVVDMEDIDAVYYGMQNEENLQDAVTVEGVYVLKDSFDYGADIVVHSSSKYINGSGDAISGVIIDSGSFKWDTERYSGFSEYKKYGKFAYLAKLRNGIWRNTGCCLAPMNAYLNSIGLETLGLRMERLCSNALKLAEFLKNVPDMEVNYPALADNPYYELVKEQFGGKGGAILTLRAGSKEKAFKLINNLKYACIATNIGDVRTLVIHAASTIYTHSAEQQRLSAGVYDDTIRISVGIEDIDDLIEDFRQAIEKI